MQFTKALSIGIVPRISSQTKTSTRGWSASGGKINTIKPKRALALPRATSGSSRVSSASLVPYFSVAALLAVAFLLIFNLFMVNTYATKGNELKNYQQAIRDLDNEHKSLLVQQSELGSFSKVNDAASVFGLVPVTDEEFLNTQQLSQK